MLIRKTYCKFIDWKCMLFWLQSNRTNQLCNKKHEKYKKAISTELEVEFTYFNVSNEWKRFLRLHHFGIASFIYVMHLFQPIVYTHFVRLSLWGILFCLLVFGNKHALCGNLPVQKSSARVRRAKQLEREIEWLYIRLAIHLNLANVSNEKTMRVQLQNR